MENLRVIKGKNHKEQKERWLKMRNGLKRGVNFIQQSRSKHNGKITLYFIFACLLQTITSQLENVSRAKKDIE